MNALRTLIVEDDAMIAGLLAETLEGLGHGVCAVETNIARAVAAASRWRRDGQRIERFVGGPGYGPPPKALPRVGPGSSNSEGAFRGVRLRPRR
jgi:CheY-like chemotaxis protein